MESEIVLFLEDTFFKVLQISYFFLTVLGIELKTFIINELNYFNDKINSRICFKNAVPASGVPAFLAISKIKKTFYFLKDHLKF